MNWVDIVIAVILLISTFIGLKTGIIKMALSLAGLILGIMLAGRYYPAVAARLGFIHQPNIANVLSFVLILAVAMLAASIVAMILTKIASAMMLGWVNGLGGAAFGLVSGAMLIAALLALWLKFPVAPEAITTSKFAEILLNRFPAVLSLLPGDFGSIRSFFQ